MIPRTLRLKNFMCYRDEASLDFSGLTVACISGENGAGKSALLDAITWALWGKGRSGSADELMSNGANDMEVDFQFDLGAECFRVRRYRRRKSASMLELQVGPAGTEGGDVAWRPITADSVARTQELLTKTVGMDYGTFINSAFVLQGRADEFTTSRPGDRKQLLADILGLGRYDELEALARDRRRASELGRRDVERDIQRIADELASGVGKQEELARLNERLIRGNAELDRLNQELAILSARRAEQELRAATAGEARERIAHLDLDLRRIDSRIARDRATLELAAETIAEGDAIRRAHEELLRAEALEADLHARGKEYLRLAARERDLERMIDTAAQVHQRRLLAVEQEIRRLRLECDQRPSLEARHEALRRSVRAVEEAQARDAELRVELQTLEVEQRERASIMATLKQQMNDLKELQRQIVGATASCPTCRRPLSADERERIRQEYETDGKRLAARYRELHAATKSATEKAGLASAERERLALVLQRRTSLDREAGQVAHQLDETIRASEHLAVKLDELATLTKVIEGHHYAEDEKRQLQECRAAVHALGWDEQEYAAVRERVSRLKPQRAKFEALSQAEASVSATEERLAEETAVRAQRVSERAREAAREAELLASTAGLPALIAQVDQVQLEQARLTRQQADLTREHGAILALVTRLADLEVAARALQAERNRLADEESAYKDLAAAFGKRGIQAMIIERATPDVQDEANAILANMPGSTMRVEFRTQRETLKGELVETLDVRIGDEAGERDYAMYSGGESFRVNFAIRVALSKLLTRRAGAKLQTLVIDEGFGTQDERGRDGIVEAISAIERDFATILIITHINELKDAFPRQIAIEKTATGSRIRVL